MLLEQTIPVCLKSLVGGSLDLTDRLARDVLKQLKWSKHKGTADNVDPSLQFLAKDKFTFQKIILTVILEHDIPAHGYPMFLQENIHLVFKVP